MILDLRCPACSRLYELTWDDSRLDFDDLEEGVDFSGEDFSDEDTPTVCPFCGEYGATPDA